MIYDNYPECSHRRLLGPSRQCVEECAEGVRGYFERLERISAYLSNWRPVGKSKPVLDSSNEAGIRALLAKGRNWRDVGGEVMPELGYAIMLRNGERTYTAQARINCGLFATAGSLKNMCSLVPNYLLAKHLGEDGLFRAFESMIELWRPDEGAVHVYANPESDSAATLMSYSCDRSARSNQVHFGEIRRYPTVIQEVLG